MVESIVTIPKKENGKGRGVGKTIGTAAAAGLLVLGGGELSAQNTYGQFNTGDNTATTAITANGMSRGDTTSGNQFNLSGSTAVPNVYYIRNDGIVFDDADRATETPVGLPATIAGVDLHQTCPPLQEATDAMYNAGRGDTLNVPGTRRKGFNANTNSGTQTDIMGGIGTLTDASEVDIGTCGVVVARTAHTMRPDIQVGGLPMVFESNGTNWVQVYEMTIGSNTYSINPVDGFSQSVSINTPNSENIVAYPNPTKGSLRVSLSDGIEVKNIGLIASDGTSISPDLIPSIVDYNSGDTIYELQLGNLKSGTYYLTVDTDDGKKITRTIVKQ